MKFVSDVPKKVNCEHQASDLAQCLYLYLYLFLSWLSPTKAQAPTSQATKQQGLVAALSIVVALLPWLA